MKNKNNLRIVITFILLLVVSCIAGFICGRLVAHAKEMGSVDNTIQIVKNIIRQSFPVVFIIVSILGVVVQIIAFGQCNLMYEKLQTDKENDDLWDSLEDKLNRPMILSNVFSMLNIVLFFCFLYDVLLFDYEKTERYGQLVTILGIIIFVIATIISIVITALTLNIEKKLNPEKQGNVLDIHVQNIWKRRKSSKSSRQCIVFCTKRRICSDNRGKWKRKIYTITFNWWSRQTNIRKSFYRWKRYLYFK